MRKIFLQIQHPHGCEHGDQPVGLSGDRSFSRADRAQPANGLCGDLFPELITGLALVVAPLLLLARWELARRIGAGGKIGFWLVGRVFSAEVKSDR